MDCKIKKLRRMPYAKAKVKCYYNDDSTRDCIILQSYETDVAFITYERDKEGFKAILDIVGLYSMTTRKHISAFMREYTPFDYATAKAAYQGNYSVVWYE